MQFEIINKFKSESENENENELLILIIIKIVLIYPAPKISIIKNFTLHNNNMYYLFITFNWFKTLYIIKK